MNQKFKLRYILFALLLVGFLVLTGCGSNDDNSNDAGSNNSNNNEENESNDNDNENDSDDQGYKIEDFVSTKTNEGEPIDGGELTIGLVSSTAFEGTLNYLYQTMTTDSTLLGWFNDSILDIDSSSQYTQDGPATYEWSEDKRTWTITIRDNVNWHDGEPLKAEDLVFAHEILAHPEYDGPWYGVNQQNIVGIEEYHEGKADEISGLKVIDEKTLEMNFIESTPFMYIWGTPTPKHIFKDMDISEIAASPETREHPIGYGPFVVDRIIPGEAVVYKKNEDYWRGEVQLDQLTVKVVDPSVVVQELRTGGVDIASVPSAQYPENADMDNVEFLADTGNGVGYIGFRQGTVDEDTGEVLPDPDMKMSNPDLRRAMWHAVDTGLVVDNFYHGLVQKGTTLVSPYHPEFHDTTNPGREYDPDLANKLLDEAGYEWKDGEDFRRDPNGDELEIILAAAAGGDTAEPIAKYYMQAWGDVGLNVQLLDGRLQESNGYYDMMKQTSGDRFDMYLASLGLGSNPAPTTFKGPFSIYNYSRFQSDRTNELLEAMRSEEAFDEEYLHSAFIEWQEIMVDLVPEFPTHYTTKMDAVNNRVVNYTIDRDSDIHRYQLGVTQEEPFKAGN